MTRLLGFIVYNKFITKKAFISLLYFKSLSNCSDGSYSGSGFCSWIDNSFSSRVSGCFLTWHYVVGVVKAKFVAAGWVTCYEGVSANAFCFTLEAELGVHSNVTLVFKECLSLVEE